MNKSEQSKAAPFTLPPPLAAPSFLVFGEGDCILHSPSLPMSPLCDQEHSMHSLSTLAAAETSGCPSRHVSLSHVTGQEAQNPEEAQEAGPERAAEAGLGIRTLLPRHAGSHQEPEPQRQLRGGVQVGGLHVGSAGRGTQERES